jgi:transposase
MEHPPYSPDFAPNDYWLFLKVKSTLKGRVFQDTEDIKKKKPMILKAFPQQEFQKFLQRLQRVHSYRREILAR